MKNMNKEEILKKTTEKIGYYNYLEESKKINRRKNKILSITCGIFICGVCTISVSALSNPVLLQLGKNIIKVNGKDAEAEIHEIKSEVIYDKYKGDYVTTTSSKCITHNDEMIINGGSSEICYPLETEFESIEIFYDKNNHFCGFHITGISTDGHFDDYLKDCK